MAPPLAGWARLFAVGEGQLTAARCWYQKSNRYCGKLVRYNYVCDKIRLNLEATVCRAHDLMSRRLNGTRRARVICRQDGCVSVWALILSRPAWVTSLVGHELWMWHLLHSIQATMIDTSCVFDRWCLPTDVEDSSRNIQFYRMYICCMNVWCAYIAVVRVLYVHYISVVYTCLVRICMYSCSCVRVLYVFCSCIYTRVVRLLYACCTCVVRMLYVCRIRVWICVYLNNAGRPTHFLL